MMFLAILLGSLSTMLLLTATCCSITIENPSGVKKSIEYILLIYSAVGALITVLVTSYVDLELAVYLGVLYLIIYTLLYGYKLLMFFISE